MKNSMSKGASLSQYGIVIALLGVALVPVFFIMGETISKQFASFNTIMTDNNATIIANAGTGTGTGSVEEETDTTSEASLDKPKINCDKDSCIIDYGEYVLKGIPNNFKEYVQSSGTSGGTEYLATLIEQIAETVDLEEGTKNLIFQLANNGHSIATAERSLDSLVSTELNTANMKKDNVTWDNFVASHVEQSDVLLGKREDFDKTLELVQAMLEENSDPESKNALVMINVLSENIQTIAESTQVNTVKFSSSYVESDTDLNTLVENGYITEKQAELYKEDQDTTNQLIKDYTLKEYSTFVSDSSEITDIDSGIICGTGNGKDNGYECKG